MSHDQSVKSFSVEANFFQSWVSANSVLALFILPNWALSKGIGYILIINEKEDILIINKKRFA